MSNNNLVHPADALATALDRTAGLLQVLTDLYSSGDEHFSGGNSFVAHGIATATELVAEAKSALSDLHYSCDLALLDHPGQADIDLSLIQPATEQAAVVVPEEQNSKPVETKPNDYARSYLELLQKLTDAEVFATEQQALAAPGTSPDLLPMLRSLREDLKKLHNAA